MITAHIILIALTKIGVVAGCTIAVAACIPRAWLELLIGDPTDPNANADEARDWQGEWDRDVADSGDLR